MRLDAYSGNSWLYLIVEWFEASGSTRTVSFGLQTDRSYEPSIRAQVRKSNDERIWRREIDMENRRELRPSQGGI